MTGISNSNIELLSPAGSPEALTAAISAGTDAVYFGGLFGNARAAAKNFNESEIYSAIKLLHDYGKRAYITLNTLFYDREIAGKQQDLLRFIEFVIKSGADALILQDIGLTAVIRRYFPEAVLHASTQVAGHNSGAAATLHSLGFSRMVAARELNKKNLTLLVKNSPIEIEMFIHGALCSSYSGCCLMSYVMGGRSANRGACAQPCRLPYNNKYELSLKDLCLAGCITQVVETDVRSLKIEGRMKAPAYVYGTVSVYRRLIDEKRNATAAEINQLSKIFSRSGFTDSYFSNNIGRHMYGIRTDSDKSAAKSVTAQINIPPFKIKALDNLPALSNVNVSLPAEGKKTQKKDPTDFLWNFSTPDQLYAALPFIKEERVYFPLQYINDIKLPKEIIPNVGVRLPYIIEDSCSEHVKMLAKTAFNMGIKRAMADNIGHITDFEKLGFIIDGGAGLNVTNSFTINELAELGVESVTLSPELNLPQIRDIRKIINVNLIVYGRIRVMLCRNCIINSSGACARKDKPGHKCKTLHLADRKGAHFPVMGEYGHISALYNSAPIYLADKKSAYMQANIDTAVLFFTSETPEETVKIIKDYTDKQENCKPPKTFTRGYNT